MTTDKNRLLRAIGDIDDKYITEIIAEDAAGKKTVVKKPVMKYFMYYVPAAAALLIAILCIKAAMTPKTSSPTASGGCAEAPASVQNEACEETECDSSFFDDLDGKLPFGTAGATNNAEVASDAAASAEESSLGMPNPFIDCESLEQAADIAGFEFNIPDDFESGCTRSIRVLEDRMIEVIFFDEDGEEVYRLRKGTIPEISGDYNVYAFASSVDTNLYDGSLMGNEEGRTSCAVWSDGEFNYSLTTGDTALDADTVSMIIETLMTAK